MDQWFLNYLDEHFRETSRQIEGLREENAQQLASLREELARRIVGLRSEMMQRLERLDANFRLSRLELEELRNDNDVVAEQVNILHERLGTFSDWATARLLEMQESGFDIKTSARGLETRVHFLEAQAVREGRDPIERVRQLLVKYPGPTIFRTGPGFSRNLQRSPQSVTGSGPPITLSCGLRLANRSPSREKTFELAQSSKML
ncbi:MAG: hypothetical protein JF614_09455 [Acidobacteria bacterium]|nr:hypothetical protein [Acidobacteriota bacterium]